MIQSLDPHHDGHPILSQVDKLPLSISGGLNRMLRFSTRVTTRQTPRRQDLQPIPTHNKYSCISDTSHENASGYFPECLPGQKHKTLSPLSEEGSPKKQKDNNLPRSNSRDRDNTPRKQITDNSTNKDTESSSNTNNVDTMDTNVDRTHKN